LGDRAGAAAQAVTTLYRRHAHGLTRLAFIMLGDRQSAEDVAQEAAPTNLFITPDGTKLIGGTGKRNLPPARGPWTGELSVYSTRTGALLQRLAPWKWNSSDRRPGMAAPPGN
jgi:hypothetical protein